MARDLSDFHVGTWVLTLDLLGTSVQMGLNNWVEALNRLLDAISISVREVLAADTYDLYLVQYGDSVTMCHNELQRIICLGTKVQVTLFRQNILAQLGLSGNGAYYFDDTTIHRIVEGMPNFKLHCIAGSGLARSHLVLRGIKGPRFIVDEEVRHVPANGPCWEKLVTSPNPHGLLKCSELRWWKDFPDILRITEDRIRTLQSELESEKAGIEADTQEEDVIQRVTHSISKQLEHYRSFHQVLAREQSLMTS